MKSYRKKSLGSLYEDENQDFICARQDGRPIYPRTAGVSLKEVQERLGHSSIKMTGDIYAHVTPK
ncbi:hypothetical protein [Bacillus sp. Bos-x628]|uniref:hypothetical protein n=1 Tax=Bacillus maqinnsis TaxID=3229854 RepID=UPI00338D491E